MRLPFHFLQQENNPKEESNSELFEKLDSVFYQLVFRIVEIIEKRGSQGNPELENLLKRLTYAGQIPTKERNSERDIYKLMDQADEFLKIILNREESLTEAERSRLIVINNFMWKFRQNFKKTGINRREFVKTIGGALVLYETASKLMDFLFNTGEVSFDAEKIPKDLRENLNFLRDSYGITLFIGLPNFARIKNTGEDVNKLYLADHIDILCHEIKKYPPDLIRPIGLRVRFARNIKHGEVKMGGFMSPAKLDEIVVNVSPAKEKDSFAQTIHHELYHLLDFRDHDSIEGEQDSWQQFQKECALRYKGEVDYGEAGYISRYAVNFGESEDRAETAKKLMTNHQKYIDYMRWYSESGAKDVLIKKMNEIKKDYFRWSGGKMNDDFWNALSDGNLPDSYWERRNAE